LNHSRTSVPVGANKKTRLALTFSLNLSVSALRVKETVTVHALLIILDSHFRQGETEKGEEV